MGKKKQTDSHEGVVVAGAVYTLQEAAKRLGWGAKTITKAQRNGLRTVKFGRQKFVSGADVLQFFEALKDTIK